MGNCFVLAVLCVVVFLAIRSVVKSKKSGGCCNGNCGSCKGCH